jgi:hypothetical protein
MGISFLDWGLLYSAVRKRGGKLVIFKNKPSEWTIKNCSPFKLAVLLGVLEHGSYFLCVLRYNSAVPFDICLNHTYEINVMAV